MRGTATVFNSINFTYDFHARFFLLLHFIIASPKMESHTMKYMKWSVCAVRCNVCVRLAFRIESEKKPFALIRTVRAVVADVVRITYVKFCRFMKAPRSKRYSSGLALCGFPFPSFSFIPLILASPPPPPLSVDKYFNLKVMNEIDATPPN